MGGENERERPRDGADDDGRRDESDDVRRTEHDPPDAPRTCHRRGCDEPAAFAVLERYQEETGKGAVEAEAFLCRDHTDEESPANLDSAYDDYVFRVVPVSARAESVDRGGNHPS